MLQSETGHSPFPSTLAFPDVDPWVLDSEDTSHGAVPEPSAWMAYMARTLAQQPLEAHAA